MTPQKSIEHVVVDAICTVLILIIFSITTCTIWKRQNDHKFRMAQLEQVKQ